MSSGINAAGPLEEFGGDGRPLKGKCFQVRSATGRVEDRVEDRIEDEEWANGLTHAIGCTLSIVGGLLLLDRVVERGFNWSLLACLAFGASLISVYAASTLSHWVRAPQWRDRFRIWDQGLIYLLIASSYTPFAVAYFADWWWLTLLVWILALAGFASKVGLRHRVEGIAVGLYLGLGWLPVVAMPKLIIAAPWGAFALVTAGGVAYTAGTLFLMNDHRARFLHVVWHLFVILGSSCHFLAVWRYVALVA